MPAEIKSSRIKVEARVSQTLRARFKKHCKKLNVTVGQRLRDLMQKDLKG